MEIMRDLYRKQNFQNQEFVNTLLCVIVGGGGGWLNCKFWGKKPSSSFNHYKRITYKQPPPILRNLDNFPPGAFYSTQPPHLYN